MSDGRGPGLCLEITPPENKHWRLRFAFRGRRLLKSLGDFPAVGLQSARVETRTSKKTQAEGKGQIRLAYEVRGEPFRAVALGRPEGSSRSWPQTGPAPRSAGKPAPVIRKRTRGILPDPDGASSGPEVERAPRMPQISRLKGKSRHVSVPDS
ncbi:MAG: Arm DNA-binding domain-containing protein [Deltaproteobacteria bacterium]|nr:Arm DNA-binding domain-containing protein [Deltaproteobacteria bacterium]